MRAEIAAIERLLKTGKSCVRRNPTWDRIHEETGAGTVIGRELRFTHEDRHRLRVYVQSQTGLDPQFDSRAGGRMAVAKHDASEKLSSDSVFGELLVIATAGSSSIAVQGREVQTAPGSVISVLPDRLDRDRLQEWRLVVIENGAVMPYWSDICLPGAWQDAVLIYRGHRENLRTVETLVNEHPGEKLAFFHDFDPAGLAMACRHGKGMVMVPADWPKLGQDSGFNQPDIHRKQLAQLQPLQQKNRAGETSVIGHMAKEQLAVMQEHMVSRRMALEALAIGELFTGAIGQPRLP